MDITYGEIYQLGNHRLMCGDATKRGDILKLVGNDKIDLKQNALPLTRKFLQKNIRY